MRSSALIILLIGSIVVIEASPAYACSCVPAAAAEIVAQGDAAFVGTLTAKDAPVQQGPFISSGDPQVSHFAVETVIKGQLGSTTDVTSAMSPATCGLELAVGQRTGLVLRATGGGWSSSLCHQVEPEALLSLVAPAPAPPPPPAAAPIAAPIASVVASPSAQPPSPSPSPSQSSEEVDLAASEDDSGFPLLPVLAVVAVVAVVAAAGLVAARRLRRTG